MKDQKYPIFLEAIPFPKQDRINLSLGNNYRIAHSNISSDFITLESENLWEGLNKVPLKEYHE